MDFFEAQAAAARRTRLLTVLFAAAVLAIVCVIYLVVSLGVTGGRFDPTLFLMVAAGVGAVIGGGSLHMMRLLGRDGSSVALRLGGRPVATDTQDPDERRILNVVEEMSLAAGIPVPSVFILDQEEGINAFAAGMEPGSAAVAVTRGALTTLDRSELQGVVGHEVAHILSGDMRLNLRLVGLVHGLLLITIIGRGLLRTAPYRSRGRNSGGAQVVALGAALVGVGYIGVLFGRLIKAAISRQREFAADAAATQFTRDPGALGGALKKILGTLGGSSLAHPRAEEASHMFFSNALRRPLFAWTATHPPLEERIRRLDPRFSYDDVPVRVIGSAGGRAAGASAGAMGLAGGGAPITRAPAAVESIGNPGAPHLAFAAEWMRSAPATLQDAAHRPLGAEAVVYALLLSGDPEVRSRQLERIAGTARPGVAEEAERLAGEAAGLPRRHRLPLVDVAIASLRDRTGEDRASVVACAHALARADGRLGFAEVLMGAILDRHLLHGQEADEPRHRRPEQVGAELTLLFGLLARAGSRAEAEAALAYGSGAALFPRGLLPGELPPTGDLRGLDAALRELADTAPELKRRIIRAAAEIVLCDGEVSELEAELLRLVADRLGCPMPPLRVTSPAPASA
jgi:Zn-dependent protease with chaperone function